jgi:diacylglycerol kinase
MESKHKRQSEWQSFRVAFNGIRILIAECIHFRIHLAFALSAIAAGFYFGIDRGEWFAVLLTVALVLLAEVANTCIEYICDLVSPDEHPLIKKIKVVSAGMVLITAIIAVVIGCVVFVA